MADKKCLIDITYFFEGINRDFMSDHFGVLTEIRAVSMPGGVLFLCLGLLAMAGLGGKFKQN